MFGDRLYISDLPAPHAGRWLTNGHVIIRQNALRHADGLATVAYMEPGTYIGLSRTEAAPPDLARALATSDINHPELRRTELRHVGFGADDSFEVLVTKHSPWKCVAIAARYYKLARAAEEGGGGRFALRFQGGSDERYDWHAPVFAWSGEVLCAAFMPVKQERFTFDGTNVIVNPW
jgi:hypothetical protein